MNDTVSAEPGYAKIGILGTTDSYKGIPEGGTPGLHPRLFAALNRHVRPPAPVADLGCGPGAFSRRLVDGGYEVTALDNVPEAVVVDHPGVDVRLADLNQDFADGFEGRFSAVCAIELIEHLENPRHLLRQIHRMLVDDGILLLSTPNVDCSVSKAMFLFQGRFLWFDDEFAYRTVGHISPQTVYELGHALAEAGFETVEHTTFGKATRAGRRTLAAAKLIARFRRPPWGDGLNHVMVLRKAEPKPR